MALRDRLPELCVMLIGMAALFAWNAVITIPTYWRQRFCGSPLARYHESAFSLAYQAAALVVAAWAPKLSRRISVRKRIVPTTYCLGVIFVLFALLAVWADAPRDSVFAPATVIGVALCGGLSQLLCSATYGVCAALRDNFTAANMAGQGLAGVAPALAVVLVALSSSGTPDEACVAPHIDKAAVLYFVASALLFGAAVVAFGVLERSTRYIASGLGDAVSVEEDDDEEAEPDLDTNLLENDGDIASVCRSIALPALSVFLVFTCTLSVFPALTSLTRAPSNANALHKRLFVPLLFLEFNALDTIGRASAACFTEPSSRTLVALSALRFAFVPCFIFDDIEGGPTHGPALLQTTAAPFLLMAPFALSNGLLAALALTAAPPLVAASDRELAGNLMGLFLVLGLSCGSLLSFGLVAAATG